MTDTTPIPTINEASHAEPDYLEDLLRARHFKLLYWRVGDPQRLNEDIPEAGTVADLDVVFMNGRRYFRSIVVLDIDVIYGLVGQDDLGEHDAEFAVDQILEKSREMPDFLLEMFDDDEQYASAIGTWTFSDGDLIRAAAAQMPDGDYATLFRNLAAMVDSLPPYGSFTNPEVQAAAVATQIAWDLL